MDRVGKPHSDQRAEVLRNNGASENGKRNHLRDETMAVSGPCLCGVEESVLVSQAVRAIGALSSEAHRNPSELH